jgi:hypothetical protein
MRNVPGGRGDSTKRLAKNGSMLIIVRREAADRYRRLQALAVEVPIEIIWDRRVRERRRPGRSATVERRRRERRAPTAEARPIEMLGERPRSAERRQRPEARMPERRHGERRSAPPPTWTGLDFLLVKPPR